MKRGFDFLKNMEIQNKLEYDLLMVIVLLYIHRFR